MPTSPKTFRSKERAKEREEFRGSKQARGYGGEWEKISLLKRQEDPVCEVCRNAAATQVDHIVAFKDPDDPRRTEWTNLQSICNRCHWWKTTVARNQIAITVIVCGLPGTGKTTLVDRHKHAGAIVFDLDMIAATLCPEWRYNSGRPIEANALLSEWRDILVNRIAGSQLLTQTWIIVSDKEKAEQIARRLSARLICCAKNGSQFTTEFCDFSV